MNDAAPAITSPIAASPTRTTAISTAVPLGNTIRSGDLRVLGGSGGVRVFVDQAAQDGASVDPCGVEVGHGGAGRVTICVGDMLSDALVRPGRVVVRLIFGEDGAQVRLAVDQCPVGDFAAQGADEALADRVHPGRLAGAGQDPGAGWLKHGVERGGEVRPAVADQEPDVPGLLAGAEGEIPCLLNGPLAGRVGGDAAEVHPAGAVLDEHQDVKPVQQHGVHVQEIHCEDPGRLGVQELPPGRA